MSKPLTLMEGFFLADANHRPRIRPVAAAAKRHLVHDRRTIHQPADGADVGPGLGAVIEDARIFGLAGMQRVDQFIAADPERFRCTVR